MIAQSPSGEPLGPVELGGERIEHESLNRLGLDASAGNRTKWGSMWTRRDVARVGLGFVALCSLMLTASVAALPPLPHGDPPRTDRLASLQPEDVCPDSINDATRPTTACITADKGWIFAPRLHFAVGKTALEPRNHAALDSVVALLKRYDIARLVIGGHLACRADRRVAARSPSYDRAAAVRDYLVRRGIGADRLHAFGYGHDRPVFAQDDTKHRRISFAIERFGVADCTDVCASQGLCKGTRDGCVVGSDADCAKTAACREHEHCRFNGRKDAPDCVPSSDAACAKSDGCASFGRCHFQVGVGCVARDAEACRASWGCKNSGLCTLEGQTCRLGSDDDCAKTRPCKADGKCSFRGGQCVAATNADCQQSEICRWSGRCVVGANNQCVPTPGGCEATPACRVTGACEFRVDGDWRSCRPSARGCRESQHCKEKGKCSVQDGACVALSDADCGRGACGEHGLCKAWDRRCVPRHSEDCRTSARCRSHGLCVAFKGRCVKDAPLPPR